MEGKDVSTLRDDAARAVELGALRDAVALYEELERRQPDQPAWPKRIGEALRRLGDPAAAMAAFERSVERYCAAGFLVQALAVSKQILQIDPSHAATLGRLAELGGARAAARPAPQVTLPPGAAIDAVPLAEVVPGAERLRHADGSDAGIARIPLDDGDPSASHSAIDLAIAAAEPEPPPVLGVEAHRALRTTPLLAGLPTRALESLMNRLALVELAPAQVLFREGEPGRCLYVVADGEVAVETAAGGELARLSPGAFFGEVSLVTDLPRSATVRAAGAAALLAFDRDVLRALIEEHPVVLGVVLRFVRERLVDKVMRTAELFRPFSPAERAALTARFELVEVEPGTSLVAQGARADGLYVMLAGRADVWREGIATRVAALGPGEVFGEMSLLGGGGAIAHVRAGSRVLALRMPARTFQEVIMTHPQVLAYVGDLAERRRPRAEAADDMVDLHLDLL
jgi:CRP-like cAMP-binding protein